VHKTKEPQLQQAVTAHLTGTLFDVSGTHAGLQTVTVHAAIAPISKININEFI
jgi:hypothetical protein